MRFFNTVLQVEKPERTNTMKTWEEFDTKYRNVIGEIAKSNPMGDNPETDLGNARRMLTYMAEHPEGEQYKGVPADFDWQGCREDIASIMAEAKENR